MMTVKIKDTEYPCQVTMGALRRFKKETGKEVSEITDRDLSDLVTFLCCCIISASKAEGHDCPYGIEELADMMDPSQLDVFLKGELSEDKKKDLKASPLQ